MATIKDTIIKNFKRGLWTEDMLWKLVEKGKISALDYAEIVGNNIDVRGLQIEQAKKILENAVEAYMDSVVQTRGYKNIQTAVSYANSTNANFAREGIACNKWRDAVWEKFYKIVDKCEIENNPFPSLTELIAELPKIEWGD